MAALGGLLAAAILKQVADQIVSAIGGQIKLQKNFDKDLKKMKMALESVEAVLKAAERRSITDEPTLLWLKRLTDAMYDISSMIDEFEADTHATTQPSTRKLSLKKCLLRFVSCLPIGPKTTMANQMKMMRDELKEITHNHQSFTLAAGTNTIQLSVTDIRETSSTMGENDHIVGRTDETENILGCLSDSMEKEFIVLPIYGIGGLGKTTLAKIVFNNSQFRCYSQVWIYVSQSFDLKKIGNSIISQLSKEKSQCTDMQTLHNSLRELLANKKILIVLDDLWEDTTSHLDELMKMLKVGESRNVVVIATTRSKDIAMKISTIQPHKLASLTDEMCWNIIKQKSAFDLRNDQEELEHIGKEIASKCGGVALAAQSLGHMLHSLTFNEWESMRNSDIWNVYDSEDTSLTYVLSSLRLSYSVMPSNLKLCFAYCAIFPKGYKIVKDDLIQQWISLDFIKATSMLSPWQLGEKYIRQLVGLSFLEHLKSPSNMEVNFENDTMFTMHDLVHDLARSVMVDEIVVASKQGITGGNCCHFALLNDCGKPLESSKIRALRFMECGEIELHGAAFSYSKYLRVLDLSECSIHKLPDSIGVLKQLRYLNAPRVQDATIPNCITMLSKLMYLNLHGSPAILALPESIGEIGGLTYLDLSGCSGIEKLPESFGRLKELVHLDFSNCSSVGGISEFLGSLTQLEYLNLSYCPNIGRLPEDLGNLSKLQYLNLSFSSYLDCCKEAEVLGALNKLEYLNLSSRTSPNNIRRLPEALGTFIQLKYLNLSGCYGLSELPRSFRNLKNLVHLDLSDCHNVHGLDEALVGLSNLQFLNLQDSRIILLPEDVTKLRYLNVSRLTHMSEDTMDSFINYICSNLSDLEHLDLSDNIRINSIPESICNLRKLHTLNLSKCYILKEIPESIGTIDSLKFLDLYGCWRISKKKAPQLGSSAISLPRFGVQPGDGHSSSNLVLLQHMDPVMLKVTELENVKSVEEAQRIKLMGKKKLEDLTLEWTPDAERFVDHRILMENLVPPRTLKKLKIYGYNGVSFPAWLVLDQLPNLERLILRGMASLEEWNTSYPSGEEHVIEVLEIHDCLMLRMKPLPPKAKKWVISNSDNVLSSWEECTGSHTNAASSFSPVTTELSVKNYKVPMHQWRLLQHFPGLTCLHIKGSVDLTGSPEITRHLSSLKTLKLEGQDLEELPKWLGELTSLKELDLWSCYVLSLLPASMQQLTSLRTLEIFECPKLYHLGERVCLLPSSLSSLQIWKCNGIKCLPKGMEQLTNLQILSIYNCPDLKQWCELEENKMKLAHIEIKVPSSLSPNLRRRSSSRGDPLRGCRGGSTEQAAGARRGRRRVGGEPRTSAPANQEQTMVAAGSTGGRAGEDARGGGASGDWRREPRTSAPTNQKENMAAVGSAGSGGVRLPCARRGGSSRTQFVNK